MVGSAEVKRILILGGSELQVPAVETAIALGIHVGLIDRDPNAPGARLANEYYQHSARDVDAILDVARSFAPDGILTLASDMPMKAVAHVAAKLGLAGPSESAVSRATDKIVTSEVLALSGVRHPKSVAVENIDDLTTVQTWNFPIVLKPADSSGSRGVVFVHSAEDVERSYSYSVKMSPTARVIAQEYLSGPEISIEGFCFAGQVEIVSITDKVTTGPPHFVELGHSQPSNVAKNLQEDAALLSKQAIAALGLDCCAFHAELIIVGSRPHIIEVGPRLGGDFISTHLVPLTTGVDMVKALIDLSLGSEPDLTPTKEAGGAVVFLGQPGHDANLQQALASTGVVSIGLMGDGAERPITNSTERYGHVITKSESAEQAVSDAQNAVTILTSQTRHEMGTK